MAIPVNQFSGIIKGNEDLISRNPELREYTEEVKPRKYHNEPAIFDGVTFDSGKEAARAAELTLALKSGEIICLAYHVRFLISPPKCKPIYYEADFVYLDKYLKINIEDVKSEPTKTRLYRAKKKLFEGKYGLKIVEI